MGKKRRISGLFKVAYPQVGSYFSVSVFAEAAMTIAATTAPTAKIGKNTLPIKHAGPDLKLERIAVIYPGTKRYELHKKVSVVPFSQIMGGMKVMFEKGS